MNPLEFGAALTKQYVTNKLLDKGIKSIEKYTDTSSDEDKDKSGLVSQQKTGGLASILGRALAFSLFGPILGPLAFAGGKGLLNLGQKRGFLPGGEDSTAPTDPRGTFTAEGMQFENIQDALGSTDPNKDIDYNTGVITDKTTGEEIGNVYDEVALTNVPEPPAYDFDDSSGDSGSSGGSSSASTAGDAPGYSGPSTFRYGGLASLYR